MSNWKPNLHIEIEQKEPWEKALEWAKSKQEILAVAAILILLVSVGIPYYLKSQAQTEKDALQKLNVAQYYLGSKVDPKNGPFKTDDEKYKNSLQQFEQIYQQDAGTWAAKAAQFYVAKCQLIMGQNSQAYVSFDEASQRLKGTPLGEASMLGKAMALVMQEKWPEAIGVYNAYLTQYPNGFLVEEARMNMADAYNKSGDRARSQETLEQVAKEDPKGNYGLEAARLLKKSAS